MMQTSIFNDVLICEDCITLQVREPYPFSTTFQATVSYNSLNFFFIVIKAEKK